MATRYPLVLNGTSIQELQSGDVLNGYVTSSSSDTLTAKTITFADNTLTGVASTTTSQTLTNKTVESGVFTNGYTEESTTANTGSAYTVDFANGSTFYLTLTANCTFTFPTVAAGKAFTLWLIQDATGSRTVTWPATVAHPASTAPTLTTTASKADKLVFQAVGTKWALSVAGQNYTL